LALARSRANAFDEGWPKSVKLFNSVLQASSAFAQHEKNLTNISNSWFSLDFSRYSL